MADERGRAYRKSHSSGLEDVRKWIGKWWGDTSDLAIRKFKMTVPPPSSIKKLSDDEIFMTASRNKRDSALHALLKYIAWVWLSDQDSIALPFQSDLVRFEQKIYMPYLEESEFIRRSHPLGGDFDWTMAQPIRRGDQHVNSMDGHIRTVDVFGKGTNIEVGDTQPFNLLRPMVDCLSNRAIWVPFPTRLGPKDFALGKYSFRNVAAYEISYA